jgi:hypothetical protein
LTRTLPSAVMPLGKVRWALERRRSDHSRVLPPLPDSSCRLVRVGGVVEQEGLATPWSIVHDVCPRLHFRKAQMGVARVVTASVWSATLFCVSPARADDVETQQKALYLVLDAADHLCVTPPVIGTGQTVELKGEASVKVDNLLKRLVDVGAAGAGQFQSENYKGVLRQDLATAIKNGNDCKLSVLTTLQEKLIPASKGETSLSPVRPTVPQKKVDEVIASFQDSNPLKHRAAVRAALSDPEPEVRAAALFEVLSKLKVIGGEMTTIDRKGTAVASRGFQFQVLDFDPGTGRLTGELVGPFPNEGINPKYTGVVQDTSLILASAQCRLDLELDTARSLRGTYECSNNTNNVIVPVM